MKTILAFLDNTDPSFPKKMAGICRFARTRKWHVEVVPEPERPTRSISSLIDFWKPIGCLIEGCNDKPSMSRNSFGNTPIVYLHHTPQLSDGNAPIVQMDNWACVELAINELLMAKPRHLAYVPHPPGESSWSGQRQRAFEGITKQQHISTSIFSCSPKKSLKIKTIHALKSFLGNLPKPCGILAANDSVAAMVAVACAMKGIGVPTEVSIIGIDDNLDICCNVTPEISSVRPDFTKGAYLAMELLDQAIRHPKRRGQHITYPPEGITRRTSTILVSRKDSEVNSALKLIYEQANTGLNAEDVLEQFSCSRRLAYSRFQNVTGKTILQAIHAVRLEKAKAMLSNPRQPLDVIANLCGYSTVNAFRKFFTKATHCAPNTWRQQHVGS